MEKLRIDILNFLAERERETKIFFIIFYLVGILGLGLSITHQLTEVKPRNQARTVI